MTAKTYAVIVAGGSGSRMGNDIPKQFLTVNEKPLLLHTLDTFAAAIPDLRIILVVSPEHVEKVAGLLTGFTGHVQIAVGGSTRFESVRSGLEFVGDDSIVLIHDAVRCLVTRELIQSCLDSATLLGNAIPAIAPRETIRLIENNYSRLIDRDHVRLVQTPQTFRAAEIKHAYEVATNSNFTDDASVLEAAGFKVHLIKGEESNIKITWPADLQIAESILRERNNVK
jgi:2-C-methyl-D-erythritol 4-phosphate cytidylyltransferase